MKKILSFTSMMILAASTAFAANLPYEPSGNDGGGDGGSGGGDVSDVSFNGGSGRETPVEVENSGNHDDDPTGADGVTLAIEMGRIFQLIGLAR
ncbi:MAG: hypothetical protein R3E12_15880 [Candidatus Eisenbacteria bacterium]|uniref:Uncharacterized protein n=1 Tax=Eiseniibacteriota bacterium TaxID=2212470 RepID=A0A956M0L2_UNCEI|nr:hypothetical protein [Candidatus Eisenbacteria bacterium]